jgi:hypothetical protein
VSALVGTGRWVKVGGNMQVSGGPEGVFAVDLVDGAVEIGVDGLWRGGGC